MSEEPWMEEILEREVARTNSGIAIRATMLVFADLMSSISTCR